MLIDIHILQNHAPSNLNRDDTGSPKDCIFGSVRRSRISSQCLKRSIRCSQIFEDEMKGIELAVRTRRLPELIKEKLLKDGIDPKMADIAMIKATGFGTKEGKEREKELNTAQTMFITQKDVDAVAAVMKEAIESTGNHVEFKKISAKDLQEKAILKGWRPITPDIALFGRMTTSDAFRDVEASMQVAHAISTNKMEHEFDYFTAVDDLQKNSDDSTGADMIGDVEFNSACFYKYFSLDYDALVRNLAGEEPGEKATESEIKAYTESVEKAKNVASITLPAFLKAAIFTAPSGKQNTFAAHQLPDAILIEIKPKKIPVSYANAFLTPYKPNIERDLVQDSIQKLADHSMKINKKFNIEIARRLWFSTSDTKIEGTEYCDNINDMIQKLTQVL